MSQERLDIDNGMPTLCSIVEEGGWIIRFNIVTRQFALYEVPQFGGEERFYKAYEDIVEAIQQGRKWT